MKGLKYYTYYKQIIVTQYSWIRYCGVYLYISYCSIDTWKSYDYVLETNFMCFFPQTSCVSFLLISSISSLRRPLPLSAISFFEHVNLLYSCLSEYCNVTDCSSMNGPQQR